MQKLTYIVYLQSSSTSFSKKLVVKSVFGLVSLTLVVALTLTAVYLGGKITNEVVKVRTEEIEKQVIYYL